MLSFSYKSEANELTKEKSFQKKVKKVSVSLVSLSLFLFLGGSLRECRQHRQQDSFCQLEGKKKNYWQKRSKGVRRCWRSALNSYIFAFACLWRHVVSKAHSWKKDPLILSLVSLQALNCPVITLDHFVSTLQQWSFWNFQTSLQKKESKCKCCFRWSLGRLTLSFLSFILVVQLCLHLFFPDSTFTCSFNRITDRQIELYNWSETTHCPLPLVSSFLADGVTFFAKKSLRKLGKNKLLFVQLFFLYLRLSVTRFPLFFDNPTVDYRGNSWQRSLSSKNSKRFAGQNALFQQKRTERKLYGVWQWLCKTGKLLWDNLSLKTVNCTVELSCKSFLFEKDRRRRRRWRRDLVLPKVQVWDYFSLLLFNCFSCIFSLWFLLLRSPSRNCLLKPRQTDNHQEWHKNCQTQTVWGLFLFRSKTVCKTFSF